MTLAAEGGKGGAIAAAGVAAATDVGYILVILREGEGIEARVYLVAGFIGAMAVFAAAGVAAAVLARVRLALLAGSAGGLLGLGVLGIFSIGVFLLLAGILAAVAWFRSPRDCRSPLLTSSAAALASVLALIGGVAAT